MKVPQTLDTEFFKCGIVIDILSPPGEKSIKAIKGFGSIFSNPAPCERKSAELSGQFFGFSASANSPSSS